MKHPLINTNRLARNIFLAIILTFFACSAFAQNSSRREPLKRYADGAVLYELASIPFYSDEDKSDSHTAYKYVSILQDGQLFFGYCYTVQSGNRLSDADVLEADDFSFQKIWGVVIDMETKASRESWFPGSAIQYASKEDLVGEWQVWPLADEISIQLNSNYTGEIKYETTLFRIAQQVGSDYYNRSAHKVSTAVTGGYNYYVTCIAKAKIYWTISKVGDIPRLRISKLGEPTVSTTAKLAPKEENYCSEDNEYTRQLWRQFNNDIKVNYEVKTELSKLKSELQESFSDVVNDLCTPSCLEAHDSGKYIIFLPDGTDPTPGKCWMFYKKDFDPHKPHTPYFVEALRQKHLGEKDFNSF